MLSAEKPNTGPVDQEHRTITKWNWRMSMSSFELRFRQAILIFTLVRT